MGRRGRTGNNSETNNPLGPDVNVHTVGNIHLMYSPDSTFGIRPYLSRAEDKLKIVSVMKLYDQRRYDNHASMNDGNPQLVRKRPLHSKSVNAANAAVC